MKITGMSVYSLKQKQDCYMYKSLSHVFAPTLVNYLYSGISFIYFLIINQ